MQPVSDDVGAARGDATTQESSDNAASPATLEKGATPSSPSQTVSDGESVTTKRTQVPETRTEEERLSATAPERDSQPCSDAAPESNLAVSAGPPSLTPVSDKPTEQQTEVSSDNSTEDRPDAVQIPADRPSNTQSGPLSSLTSAKETGSTAPERSEQIPQECDLMVNRSASVQNKDETISRETQNLSDNENQPNTEQHTFAKQTDTKEDQEARDKRCYTDDPNTKKSEYSADPCPATKETYQNTEVVYIVKIFINSKDNIV